MNTDVKDSRTALVIGASGAIGQAFCEVLSQRGYQTTALHRRSNPPVDLLDEQAIEHAAKSIGGPFDVIIHAGGLLHTSQFMPEKKLSQLSQAQLLEIFQINTFGPALVMKHFSPLLSKQRAVFALLSAKVGSISDNRLGGWYSYRSSKAALNMMIKTASIELTRTHPQLALVALHPGTVQSALSRPFRGDDIGRKPVDAAIDMLNVLEGLTSNDTGKFFSYSGEEIGW